jgi:formylglycine-generating enzyme required for sulfatase activity
MSNGQGSGDTENGVYDMSLGINAVASSTSSYRLPTEDEWYKAAYYDPTKGGATDADNYWLHAMQSDTLTDNSTQANYNDGDFATTQSGYSSSENYLTDVGSYVGQESYYGTFDQGGNVWELNDAVISGSSRGLRGGSWGDSEFFVRSSIRGSNGPSAEGSTMGFRLASVPEPSSIALLGLGSLSLLLRRKRC